MRGKQRGEDMRAHDNKVETSGRIPGKASRGAPLRIPHECKLATGCPLGRAGDPSEMLHGQTGNRRKVPHIGRGYPWPSSSAVTPISRSARAMRVPAARLHLSSICPARQSDRHSHGMDRHSRQQIVEKLLPARAL